MLRLSAVPDCFPGASPRVADMKNPALWPGSERAAYTSQRLEHPPMLAQLFAYRLQARPRPGVVHAEYQGVLR